MHFRVSYAYNTVIPSYRVTRWAIRHNPIIRYYTSGNTPLTQCYKKNEQEKKRAYDERVREVEHGTFSPLVFSTSGGMGATANVVYKRLASMIAEKQDQPYSRTIQWIRCRLCFSLLRSAIMCLRGSRSTYHHPTGPDNIELASSEGRISSEEN